MKVHFVHSIDDVNQKNLSTKPAQLQHLQRP